MTKAATIKKQITEAQARLKALRSDRPKIVALLDGHTAILATAKKEGADFEHLAELQAKRDAFASVLTQHDDDIEALEAQIATLQERYDKQSAGERLAVAKEHHETLMGEYRDRIRQTLNTVQNVLRGQLEKRGQVEARRAEIESLGLKLGIYQRSTQLYSRYPVKGPNFSRLYPAALPGLFDDAYPKLKKDEQVLELLDQIARADEVVTSGDTRQVLAHREVNRVVAIHERATRLQAEALAAVTPAEQ
jgi:ABC-type transporter Mla subunit MlaD